MTQHGKVGLTPEGRLAILPAPPVASSVGLGWAGLRVERQQSPSVGVLEQPPLADHLILFYFKPSARLTRVCDGVARTGQPPPHSFTLIPAGCTTFWNWQGRFDMLNVLVSPGTVERIAEEGEFPSGHRSLFAAFDLNIGPIRTLLMSLDAEMTSGGVGGRLYAESLTTALVVQLLRLGSGRNPRPRPTVFKLDAVLDYIRSNLASDLPLADLAAVAGVTTFHFSREFKRAVGRTPHQYIVAERVEQAKNLILAGKHSLAHVAQIVGFSDQSHLHRHFKRLVGVTPGQYR